MNYYESELLNTKKNGDAETGRFFLVCIFLILWFAVFSIVNGYNFTYVEVVGQSMENTLSNGDILLVNRRLQPNYGNIIIISGEKDNGDLIIKRVIGTGGDQIVIQDGNVYRNGVMLNEPYVKGNTYFENANTAKKVYDIPDGELFYLGDNREHSSDSRSAFGTCNVTQVVGVVPEIALSVRPLAAFRVKFSQRLSSLFGG